MYCPECGTELLVGAESCPNCGHPLTPSGPNEKLYGINVERVKGILDEAGYTIKVLKNEPDRFLIGKPDQTDVGVLVWEDQGAVEFYHTWKTRDLPPKKKVELLETISRANQISRLSSFYLDPEESKVKARSRLALSRILDRDSLLRFLEAVEEDLPETMTASGLLGVL
jgi:hypothetical protein